VRSRPGEARTILLLYIISGRPSKQSLMVRTFLKVYMELDSYCVSARTNKRHHHHRVDHLPRIVWITSLMTSLGTHDRVDRPPRMSGSRLLDRVDHLPRNTWIASLESCGSPPLDR
jgi:hypothetical protein